MPDQKTMRTRCVGGFPVMWVTKLLIFPVKKGFVCSKTTKSSPKLAFLTVAGSFGALLIGRLVVVARGLYLARHLFTLLLSLSLSVISLPALRCSTCGSSPPHSRPPSWRTRWQQDSIIRISDCYNSIFGENMIGLLFYLNDTGFFCAT